jgi:hypothetical protein
LSGGALAVLRQAKFLEDAYWESFHYHRDTYAENRRFDNMSYGLIREQILEKAKKGFNESFTGRIISQWINKSEIELLLKIA